MLRILPCVCHTYCFLDEVSFQIFCLLLKLGWVLVSECWGFFKLYNLDSSSSLDMWLANIFFRCIAFRSLDSVIWKDIFFILMKFGVLIFIFLWVILLILYLRNLFPIQVSKGFSWVFFPSLRNSRILDFSFRSPIQFKLILCRVRGILNDFSSLCW